MSPEPMSPEWLELIDEPVIDPECEIVDPHHHLWPDGALPAYELEELWADTGSGHRVVKTLFVECGSEYRVDGPEHLRPVGETDYVSRAATASRDGGGRSVISGIVAHADLRSPHLDEVLDAHDEAGGGLFKGIRHALSCARHPEELMIPGRAPEGLARDEAFRGGVARLGERGLTYDTWHYHHQNVEFAELARAVPGTTMVLDHFGTPVGVGTFAGQRDEIFATWRYDMAEVAECPNVVLKAGGMAMPDNGFEWHLAERPPSSEELLEAQGEWYRHAIDCFGPDRVMFESNFPVDRLSLPYSVYWNAMKKLVAGFDEADQQAMFSGTATRVYRL